MAGLEVTNRLHTTSILLMNVAKECSLVVNRFQHYPLLLSIVRCTLHIDYTFRWKDTFLYSMLLQLY